MVVQKGRILESGPQLFRRQDEAEEPASMVPVPRASTATTSFETVNLDRKECTYSYFADPLYVFMDSEYNQYEIEARQPRRCAELPDDGMPLECVLRRAKRSRRNATTVVREVGTPNRRARRHLGQGHEAGHAKPHRVRTAGGRVRHIGDMIEIDTRTNEFKAGRKDSTQLEPILCRRRLAVLQHCLKACLRVLGLIESE